MRILVVEDDLPLTRRITATLTEVGHTPVSVHDGETAVDRAVEASFDLIILDIGLPRIDGFEVLRRIRARHVPTRALMLTARGEVKDRVTGLQLGADDYLSKPFAMPELIARVNALGRRYAEEPALKLRVADLTLDLVNHETYRREQRLDLSARELMMLRILMREPGRVFTRTELCERIWQHPHEYDTKLVEVFIGRLRKKIGEPSLIRTVRHVGYSIREPIMDSPRQRK